MFSGFSLGNLVSSVTALRLVKVGLEKELKVKISNFDVIYRGTDDAIDFKVYDYPAPGINRRFKYDNGAIIANYFKKVVLPQKKITDSVDYVIVSFQKQTMEVYTSNDSGEKLVKTFKI